MSLTHTQMNKNYLGGDTQWSPVATVDSAEEFDDRKGEDFPAPWVRGPGVDGLEWHPGTVEGLQHPVILMALVFHGYATMGDCHNLWCHNLSRCEVRGPRFCPLKMVQVQSRTYFSPCIVYIVGFLILWQF